MANQPDYKCSAPECGKPTPREDLTVKKVTFLEMGAGGKTIRSRTSDWLCPSCVASDLDWLRPSHTAPGNQAPTMRPVRG